MKDGFYTVMGFDEKGKRVCEWSDINIGDEVYIKKTDEPCECAICGKIQKGYSVSGEYEFLIGASCIKHIYLAIVREISKWSDNT